MMKDSKVKSLLINTVHDSIVVDVYPGEENVMTKILANCNTLIVEFLPHHLKNVADVTVEQFLSLIPKQFTKLTIPSKNETHPTDIGGVVLQQMYNNKEGDDGLIFTK